jgi:glycosyltransferase involved in cell wall biosynthesis
LPKAGVLAQMTPEDSKSPPRPRVSIGLPVYNGERYVADAINAILAQTFTDFELIICDNASQDRTEEICCSYLDRDPRIHYHRAKSNQGAAANYRWAFHLARGEYFKWATYDDLCDPEYVARCVAVLDRDPSVVLAYCKTRLIDEHGQVISEYEDNLNLCDPRPSERFIQFMRRFKLSNAMYGVVRASALKKTRLLGNYIGADVPFLAELALQGHFREIPEFHFYRRFHPQASSSYSTSTELLNFYDPRKRERVALTQWRHTLEYYRAVARAPISLGEKTRLTRFVSGMVVWNRFKLAHEFLDAVRQKARKLSGSYRQRIVQ